MKEVKQAGLILLGTLAGIAILLIYSAFAWGFVLYKLYGWFLMPVFTTLPVITFTQAVGIMLFLRLFKSTDSKEKKIGDQKIKSETNWGLALSAPWIVLAITAFIKLFL